MLYEVCRWFIWQKQCAENQLWFIPVCLIHLYLFLSLALFHPVVPPLRLPFFLSLLLLLLSGKGSAEWGQEWMKRRREQERKDAGSELSVWRGWIKRERERGERQRRRVKESVRTITLAPACFRRADCVWPSANAELKSESVDRDRRATFWGDFDGEFYEQQLSFMMPVLLKVPFVPHTFRFQYTVC